MLTGTPLQNNVEELFSLLNFLEPAKFPILSTFMEKFGDLKTEEQVEQLKEVIRPIILDYKEKQFIQDIEAYDVEETKG